MSERVPGKEVKISWVTEIHCLRDVNHEHLAIAEQQVEFGQIAMHQLAVLEQSAHYLKYK